jgi:transposase
MEKRELNIGIDFSQKRADVGLFGSQGEKIVAHRAFSNSRTGFEQFRELVLKTMQDYNFTEINISGEATSFYWLPFFLQLAEDETLKGLGMHQYLLNPRWVKWFKKCFAPDHKTDIRDSYYIAERTRTKPPSYEWQVDKHWMRMRFYTRLRFHLVQDMNRAKNFYHAYLFVLNSAYTQQNPFANTFGKISSQILSHQEDLDWIATAEAVEVVEYLEQIGGQYLAKPNESAQKLQQVSRERFQIGDELACALQQILNLVMEQIRFIAQQINQVEKWIAAETKTHPEIKILRSVPGVGFVCASGIAAEIGDIRRFFQGEKWDCKRKCYRPKNIRDIDSAIAKLAGLWWPRSSSGEFEAEDRKMARSGNRYLRYYLVEAADHLRRWTPAYSDFYKKKYDEVTKHRHKRALVLTARKSIRLYVGLLHRMEPFRSKEN